MSWIFIKKNHKVKCTNCDSLVALVESDTFINHDYYDEDKGAFIQCPCGHKLTLSYLRNNGVSLFNKKSCVSLIDNEVANHNKISILNLN